MTAARFGDLFVGDWYAKSFVQFPFGTRFRGGVVDVEINGVVNVELEEKVEAVDLELKNDTST